jgi:hypothetical protein
MEIGFDSVKRMELAHDRVQFKSLALAGMDFWILVSGYAVA